MSKRTQWTCIMSSEDWKLLDREEKIARHKDNLNKYEKSIKRMIALKKMPYNKPKMVYTKTKPKGDEDDVN